MRETSITPRGRDWERRQSGWLIPSALGLSGPALMFAGAKAKVNRWIAEGLGLTAVEFGVPLLFGLSKVTLMIALGGWLAAFIQSLAVRREYLIRLDAVTNMIDNNLRQQIAHDYGSDPSQLGDRVSGYIPPQNGSFVQTHDQDFGIKRNATPLMRGAPVHNNPKGYYNGERYSDEKNRRSRSVPPYTPPPAEQPAPEKKKDVAPVDKFRAEPEIYEHTRLMQLDDFFINRSKRAGANVYFYRISGYNFEIGRFIASFCEAAGARGMVIDRELPPPNNEALLHYENIIGRSFSTSEDFFVRSMVNWLPKLEPVRRRRLARSMFNTMNIMAGMGISDNQLRNSFIKFMCWIFYDFKKPVTHLGEEDLPKIICEGTPDLDELMMLNIISDAGCDVVLLLYDGEEGYLAADPASEISDTLVIAGMRPFPEGYSLKSLRDGRADELRRYREGRAFIYSACTNQWSTGSALDGIAVPPSQRGGDPRRFYNLFARVHGVSDRGTYLQELYDLYSGLKREGRGIVTVSGSIPEPTNTEKMPLQGGTFESADQLISEMAAKIQYGLHPGLQWLMASSFSEIMKKRAESGCGLRELRDDAVHLVCWLRRYMTELFPAWQMPQVGAFIYMGGCENMQEALFLQLIACLPADVLILAPGFDMRFCLTDARLVTEEHTDFLETDRFPTDPSMTRVGTAAYHAERELDSLLYEDSGLYRDRQYKDANSITLKTMYEEIGIFWKEDLKYRPNFSIDGGTVNMPVVFSKISGVKDGDAEEYWESIFYMMTPDTVLVSRAPYVSGDSRDMEYACRRFLDRGILRRDIIISDPAFRFGYLRGETQKYMLDKLQQLLDSRVIRGMFAGNGVEFRVVAAVLGMDEYIVRMIQNFDFTKHNPKLIYIQPGESQASFEDAVTAAYLNLIGFDVAFFVPTGYQSVERFYATPMMEEHQAGEYMYDLSVPDLKNFAPRTGFEKRFRKKKK